ncbi:MBL fold metallo-hydrolase [Microlunatus elymi]|uniref:MBL fold metallo-hydrolase n=1 Tax=Microlunatus elymi TaxID=2596828 RepID=A0A516PX83_9ACTN|nr:MBL fold metallo-hydrolase [Microlunatus elymi]QDP95795.1 MBL fold metallo-hydrolase [Microlunatus elymi]
MELTIVGCSGSLSGPRSPASSYLITAPYRGSTFRLVVDLGAGSLGSLYGLINPAEVDAIAISHLHPDHCIDLCAFHVASRYAPDGPWKPVDLYGPPGTPQRISRAYDPSADSAEPEDLTSTFSFQAWQSVQQIGPFTINTAVMAHPVPTYGMRIATDDAVLAYSADTGPSSALLELARDADLLLCESAFVGDDNPADLHLTGRQAAEHASAAGVGKLMITHVPPWHRPETVLAEARPYFDGPVDLARRGVTVSVAG